MRITRTDAGEDRAYRPAHDRQVEHCAPVVDVPDVERQPIVPRERVAAAHLDEASDARTHLVPASLIRRIAWKILRQEGPRTDQRHFASEHIQKLRQLIDAGSAEPAADR